MKQIKFVALGILLFSGLITNAQTAFTYPDNEDFVEFDHTAMDNSGSGMVYFPNNLGCVSPLCRESFKHVDLIVDFSLAEDFAKNSSVMDVEERTVDVKVTGYYGQYCGQPNYVKTFHLVVDKDNPRQLELIDITGIHLGMVSMKIEVTGYDEGTSTSFYDGTVKLKAGFSGEFSLPTSGVTGVEALDYYDPDVSSGTGSARTFEWDVVPCGYYESYEFQLLRLFNTDETKTDPEDIITEVDWSKALTVYTYSWNQDLRLTMAEGTGFYVWRVRGIGNYFEGGESNPDNWGPWSSTGSLTDGATSVALTYNSGAGTVNGSTVPYLFYYDQFDEEQNWIYLRIFIEGERDISESVKVKEQVTYANGLKQVKQLQTRLSSTNKIIASQTVNDFSGRAALNSLPVPVQNQASIGFKDGLMKNASSAIYSAMDFDYDDPSAVNPDTYDNPNTVLSSAGSDFSYYSDNNTAETNIPSSEGYPYSRTVFYKDGASRAFNVSGVGADLRITDDPATSHTTKTYYGSVSDDELLYVFGAEAPESKSVHKVITVDPNGFANVTYINKAGQTIATCLSISDDNISDGDPLDYLDSRSSADVQVVEVVDPPMYIGNNTYQRVKDLPVTSPMTLKIDYELFFNTVSNTCAGFCEYCDYRIEIEVYDKLNETVVSSSSFTHDLPTTSPNGSCDPGSYEMTQMTVSLSPGDYQIRQRLISFNENPGDPGNTYLESHINTLEDDLRDAILGAYPGGAGGDLTTLLTYLQNNELDNVLTYLETAPNVTPISVPAGDGNNETAYEIELDLEGTSCLTITIPPFDCPGSDCPTNGDDYTTVEFLDLAGLTTADLYYQYTPGGVAAYSVDDFGDLIENMISDGYDPCDLWNCWYNLILTWPNLLELQNQNNSNPSNPTVNLYIVNEFLNCARSQRYPEGIFPITDMTTSSGPTNGYLTHAHTHFYYDIGAPTNAACEGMFPSLSTSNFASWTSDERFQFYLCVISYNSSVPTNVSYYGDFVTQACENTCESYRDQFRNQLIFEHHANGDIIEGDQYYYSLGTDANGQPIIVQGAALPGSYSIDVYQDNLDCAVDALIEHCKTFCQISDPSNVSVSEQQALEYVMAGVPQISLFNGEFCPEGHAKITPGTYTLSSPYAHWDKVWDHNGDGASTRALVDMDKGINGGTISLLDGNTLLKMNTFGQVEWVKDLSSYDNGTSVITVPRLRSVREIDNAYLLTGDNLVLIALDGAGTVLSYNNYSGQVSTSGTHTTSGATQVGQDYRAVWYTVSGGTYREYVIAANASGAYQWNWQHTSTSGALPSALERPLIDVLDGKLVVGTHDITFYQLDNTGNQIWEAETGDFGTTFTWLADMETLDNGELAILGQSASDDLIVQRLDNTGTSGSGNTWTGTISGAVSNSIHPFDIEAGEDDKYLVVAEYEHSSNQFEYHVIQVDQTSVDWNYSFGSTVEEHLPIAISEPSGYHTIGGTSQVGTADNDKSETSANTVDNEAWFIQFRHRPEECYFNDMCFAWDTIPDTLPMPCTGPDYTDCPPFTPLSCEEVVCGDILGAIDDQVGVYISQQVAALNVDYHANCLDPNSYNDVFTLTYTLGYHHYTLMYYDRAGNVVKTVPPQGVIPSNSYTRNDLPKHTHVTDYQYNSLAQNQRSHSVDGGNIQMYYDDISRLRFSQNAKQLAEGTYSYMKYDELGRLIEVGQSNQDAATQTFPAFVNDPIYPTAVNTDWVKTVYTTPATTTYNGQEQRYLRNRISYTYNSDNSYTYYSYDPHGNVEWLVQDVPGLGKNTIEYVYDLLSGNVLEVRYNKGRNDQFYHRYQYDADNRMVLAETSVDGIVWDGDQKNAFFDVGMASKVITGQDQVQGTDFTYTIHGWLKGINHSSASVSKDPGSDGDGSTNRVAKDAFGMVLNYFDGDFERFGSVFGNGDHDHLAGNIDLYNGNIVSWAYRTDYDNVSGSGGNTREYYDKITGWKYHYDELHRLTGADFHYKELLDTPYIPTSDYLTIYSYDANGNLLTLKRNGNANGTDGGGSAGLLMDEFAYDYYHDGLTGPTSGDYFDFKNQLEEVEDGINGSDYLTDIEYDQLYTYDAIGQLEEEKWDDGLVLHKRSIEWTPYHKVHKVVQDNGDEIEFVYNSNQQRIAKKFKHNSDLTLDVNTYYVLDATGNVMAVYEETFETDPSGFLATTRLFEHDIYGSKRLGIRKGDGLVIKTEDGSSNVVWNTNYDTKNHTNNWGLPAQSNATPTNGGGFFKKPRVLETRFNSEYQSSTTTSLGMGFYGENHAILEDEDGHLLLSAHIAKSLNGVANRCVIRNVSGNLILGLNTILTSDCDWKGKSVFMRYSSDKYLFVTAKKSGKLTAYKIEKDLVSGNYEVVGSPINIGSNYTTTLNAVEDFSGDFESQLMVIQNYLGVSRLVSLTAGEILNGAPPVPTVLDTYSSPSIDGDIAFSSDGKRVAISNQESFTTSFGNGWFPFSISMVSTNIHAYDYNNFQAVSNQVTTALGGAEGCNSVSFSPNGTYVYLTTTAGTNSSIRRWNMAGSPTNVLGGFESALRTGADGNMYAVQRSYINSNDDLLVISNPDASPGLSSLPVLSYNSLLNYLLGKMPQQPLKILPRVGGPIYTRHIGEKYYELSDHLGNVRAVVTDVKMDDDGDEGTTDYNPEIVSIQDYYPFGSLMPGRAHATPKYRYGFNGMEKDDEIKDGIAGASYTTEFRQYDPRLCRWLTIDPKCAFSPGHSSYVSNYNNPIVFIDPKGDLPIIIPGIIIFVGWVMSPTPANAPSTDYAANQRAMENARRNQLWWNLATPAVAATTTYVVSVGWRASAAMIVEEGAEYIFETITGIPVIVDPIDIIEKAAKKGVVKLGKDKLESHEKKRLAEYLEGGSKARQIDRGTTPQADFYIDKKKVEFKALGKADQVNVNTGVTRLQDATKKEGVEIIDLDIRYSNGSSADARKIYERFKNTAEGKAFKGEVRIANNDGLSTFKPAG